MDLDKLIRTELAAQAGRAPAADAVLGGVPARARARRRHRAVAGAAAVAAVLAVGVPFALLDRPGPAPTGAVPPTAVPTAAPTIPARDPAYDHRPRRGDAEILSICGAEEPRPGESPIFGDDMRVRAVFADERGYTAFVASDDMMVSDCSFRWNGTMESARMGSSLLRAPGYLPPGGPVIELEGGALSVGLPGDAPTVQGLPAAGSVSREVTTVVLRWEGWPPVVADLRDGAFIGRVIVPLDRTVTAAPDIPRLTADAYDADGQLIGTATAP